MRRQEQFLNQKAGQGVVVVAVVAAKAALLPREGHTAAHLVLMIQERDLAPSSKSRFVDRRIICFTLLERLQPACKRCLSRATWPATPREPLMISEFSFSVALKR